MTKQELGRELCKSVFAAAAAIVVAGLTLDYVEKPRALYLAHLAGVGEQKRLECPSLAKARRELSIAHHAVLKAMGTDLVAGKKARIEEVLDTAQQNILVHSDGLTQADRVAIAQYLGTLAMLGTGYRGASNPKSANDTKWWMANLGQFTEFRKSLEKDLTNLDAKLEKACPPQM